MNLIHSSFGAVILLYGNASEVDAKYGRFTSAFEGFPSIFVVNPKDGPKSELAGVITLERNEGYGIAMNLGAKALLTAFPSTKVIVFVTHDIETDGLQLERLAQAAHNQDTIVGPVLFDRTVGLKAYGKKGDKTLLSPGRATGLDGACIALPTALFLQVGGFAEEYFLYYEDTALCSAIAKTGRTPVVDLAEEVSQEGGLRKRGPAGYYLLARNRIFWHRSVFQGQSEILSGASHLVMLFGGLAVEVAKGRMKPRDFTRCTAAAVLGSFDGRRGRGGRPPYWVTRSSDVSL